MCIRDRTPALRRWQTATFEAVSCSSAVACVAVGRQQRSGRASWMPLAERFSRGHWSNQVLPRESQGALTAVSCRSSSSCLAVGWIGNTCRHHVPPVNCVSQLVEHFGPGGWSVVRAPISGEATLTSVSCAGLDMCIAVGETSGENPSPLAERFDARRLTLVSPAATVLASGNEHFAGRLASVSCTSPEDCTAIGDEVIGGAVNPGGEGGAPPGILEVPLADRWDGSTWNAEPFSATLGWSSGSGISCQAGGMCVAIGRGRNAALPLARFDGNNWIAEPISLPASQGHPALSALSCSSWNACTAVGSAGPIERPKVTVLRFDGTAWRRQTLPTTVTRAASPQGPELTGVSCPTTRLCFAVGYTRASRPLVLKWAGGH